MAASLVSRRRRRPAFLVLVACMLAGLGAAEAREQVQNGPAKRDIERHLARMGIREVFSSPVFYGDFSGDGEQDAIAFVYHPSGGNAANLDVLMFKGDGRGFRFFRKAEGIYGEDPRDIAIRPGAIDVTMTTLGPNDARCCPTLEKGYTIEISSGSMPAGNRGAAGSSTDGGMLAQRLCNPAGHIQFRNGTLTIEAQGNVYRISNVVFEGCDGQGCRYRQKGARQAWVTTRQGPNVRVRGPLHDGGDGNDAALRNGVETYGPCR